MKNLTKVLYIILVVFILTPAFSGCSNWHTKSSSSSQHSSTVSSYATISNADSIVSTASSASSYVNNNSDMINNIITAASTHDISNIKNTLTKYCSKYGKDYFVISHNAQKVIFCAIDNDFSNIYYLDFSEKTPVIKNLNTLNNLEDDVFYTDAWSYDDKYFSVVSCTDVIGCTYVFNATNLKEIYETTAFMMDNTTWSPSSDSIVISVPNDNVKLNYLGGELDASTDVVVFNADKLSKRIVLPADPKYVYAQLVWDNNGITATKEYLDGTTHPETKTDELKIFE